MKFLLYVIHVSIAIENQIWYHMKFINAFITHSSFQIRRFKFINNKTNWLFDSNITSKNDTKM